MCVIMLPRRVFRCLVKTSELVISLYIWFKLFIFRLEDYQEVQAKLGLPAQKLVNHVESRWLTLDPTLLWIVDQFDGLEHYFLVNTPGKLPLILHYKTFFKRFSKIWSNYQIKCKYILLKFTLLEQLLICSTNFLCCFKRMDH